MLINFYPEYDNRDFQEAVKLYQQLWQAEGNKIVGEIEGVTGLKFIEKEINCLVFEGMSRSHPLCLRASYDEFNKKAALVHELCHRIFVGNKVRLPNYQEPKILSAHRVVDLVLYDILNNLYGKDFADKNASVESERSQEYAKAWKWALDLSIEQRRSQFKELLL